MIIIAYLQLNSKDAALYYLYKKTIFDINTMIIEKTYTINTQDTKIFKTVLLY